MVGNNGKWYLCLVKSFKLIGHCLVVREWGGGEDYERVLRCPKRNVLDTIKIRYYLLCVKYFK